MWFLSGLGGTQNPHTTRWFPQAPSHQPRQAARLDALRVSRFALRAASGAARRAFWSNLPCRKSLSICCATAGWSIGTMCPAWYTWPSVRFDRSEGQAKLRPCKRSRLSFRGGLKERGGKEPTGLMILPVTPTRLKGNNASF